MHVLMGPAPPASDPELWHLPEMRTTEKLLAQEERGSPKAAEAVLAQVPTHSPPRSGQVSAQESAEGQNEGRSRALSRTLSPEKAMLLPLTGWFLDKLWC